MKNPFKKILQNEELPDSIKKKVFDDVEVVKLSLEFADLFAVKYPSSLGELLKLTNKPDKDQ